MIHDIQGIGDNGSAPYINQTVTINGIITAYAPNLNGFYVQEQASDYDNDERTSEGIFVYYGNTNPGVDYTKLGNTVTLTGTVAEFYNNTQIKYTQDFAIDNGAIKQLPEPTVITLPVASTFDWESVEGMYVSVRSATPASAGGKLVVTEMYELGRYGQIVLTSDNVQEQYTVNHAPSVDGYAQYMHCLLYTSPSPRDS